MLILLWSAPTMTVAPFAVHIFIGGKFAARPWPVDQTLRHASQRLNCYCQHISIVMLAFVNAAFDDWLSRREKRR